eukprot:jgi/Mesen1/6525/ME000332S05527
MGAGEPTPNASVPALEKSPATSDFTRRENGFGRLDQAGRVLYSIDLSEPIPSTLANATDLSSCSLYFTRTPLKFAEGASDWQT